MSLVDPSSQVIIDELEKALSESHNEVKSQDFIINKLMIEKEEADLKARTLELSLKNLLEKKEELHRDINKLNCLYETTQNEDLKLKAQLEQVEEECRRKEKEKNEVSR